MADNTVMKAEAFFFLAILVIAVLFICVLIFYLNVLMPFLSKRDYFKKEMKRAYSAGEYQYWKKELEKLYIRSIPIIGTILNKHK